MKKGWYGSFHIIKTDTMKLIYSILLLFIYSDISSQEQSKLIKIIPEMSMKIGSQQPAVGGQFDLVAGVLFNNKYFAGIGGGYATDMGMGGSTFPLFFDGRLYFSPQKSFLFTSRDEENSFQVDLQIGMNINNNTPFKTGFLMGIGIAYLFDFIKIKEFNFPAFYAGLNLEYNRTGFYDEYRGYAIQDGYLKQTMLNIKVAFDIKAIKVNVKSNKIINKQ